MTVRPYDASVFAAWRNADAWNFDLDRTERLVGDPYDPEHPQTFTLSRGLTDPTTVAFPPRDTDASPGGELLPPLAGASTPSDESRRGDTRDGS